MPPRPARQGRLLGDHPGRDYRVADERAERAWRLFHAALGERCFAEGGVNPAGILLGFRAALLARLHPSAGAPAPGADAPPPPAGRAPPRRARAAGPPGDAPPRPRAPTAAPRDDDASWRAR